jgi:hypothetical protein
MDQTTNFFSETFFNNTGNLIHKWHHYFEIYERHFSKYRGKDVVFLEIGIYHGGSLQFWKSYFGKGSKIYAIDINPDCKKFESDNVQILIGSQEDRDFLRQVKATVPKFDILLDDGGHTMRQQIVSFEELYDHVKEDGIYSCEDIHTSYWRKYGGGFKRRGTFIEYSKNFIDFLHGLYPINRGIPKTPLSSSMHSLHYYPGVLVIEKRKMTEPVDSMTGTPTIKEPVEQKRSLWKRIMGQP